MAGEQTQIVATGGKLSNFIYLRTFPSSQHWWYAYVTCSSSQRGLQKLIEKSHNYSGGPSPGFYIADDLLFPDNASPSFFHNAPNKDSYDRVQNTEDLLHKYIIQWARDDVVDVQPLDLVEGSPEGVAELGIYETNEDRGGYQRAFRFGPWETTGEWEWTTPFYTMYLASISEPRDASRHGS